MNQFTTDQISLIVPILALEESFEAETGIDFAEDILSLAQYEYIVAGDPDSDFRIMLNFSNTQEQQKFIDGLKRIIDAYAPYLQPELKEHTLPDGSIYSEYVTNEKNRITENEIEYKNKKIAELSISEGNMKIYILENGNDLIISLSISKMESLIDQDQKVGIRPDINADEITYINLREILNRYTDNEFAGLMYSKKEGELSIRENAFKLYMLPILAEFKEIHIGQTRNIEGNRTTLYVSK